jgi:ATP-binding cassette subfamily B protein
MYGKIAARPRPTRYLKIDNVIRSGPPPLFESGPLIIYGGSSHETPAISIFMVRPFPSYRQRDMSECGTTCLAMIFSHYGLYNIQPVLRDLAHVTSHGTNLYELAEVARLFGFEADGYRLPFERLGEISLPVIAHYEGNHFVVIYKATAGAVWIADPAVGKEKLAREKFMPRWNGVVLALEPTAGVFKTKDAVEILENARAEKGRVMRDFYLALLRPFRRSIVEILLASMVLQLFAMALPFFVQGIIDKVLVFQDRKLLFVILLGMLITFGMQVLLGYARNILLTQFKTGFELDFFSRFFDHFIHLRQSYFDAHKREDFINRFQENLKIRKMFSASVLQSFIDALLTINLFVALFLYNATLAAIASGFAIAFVIVTIIFTPKLRRLEEKVFHENVKSMGAFLDTLLGMQTVKLLAIERLKFWEWRAQYRRSLNNVLRAEKSYMALGSWMRGTALLGQIAVYWLGAYMAFDGTITIGEYIAFVTLFTMMVSSVGGISTLWFMVTELSISISKLNDVFRQEPERFDLLEQRVEITSSRIELRNVSFSYAGDAGPYALRDISLAIEPGEHIGIVGRNGSGKSTLVKLLVRMYESYEGAIILGDTELARIHPGHLRRTVAMLPQEVHIFAGTIKENILLGNPEATIDDVVRAAKLADLHAFVQTLYMGYNHKVGESGSNLSGGQRLKIALARLFLSNADVVILDEASSVLDMEAESIVMRNVREHFRGKTIISVAHRIHTLQNADRIIVIDEGHLAEMGTHEELLRREGIYHKFMKTYVDF